MAQSNGVTSLHTRVERWECDHNDHWNTRFYARSFADASDALRARFDTAMTDKVARKRWHLRFHRELNMLDFIEIVSARIPLEYVGEQYSCGEIAVHFLQCRGAVAATALDFCLSSEQLPRLSAEQASAALPRGLTDIPPRPLSHPNSAHIVQLGPLHASNLTASGSVTPELLVRHCAIATTCFLDAHGMDHAGMARHKQSFMAVELSLDCESGLMPGDVLISYSRLIAATRNSLTLEHCLVTTEGRAAGVIRLVQLCVNTETRKVCAMAMDISDVDKGKCKQ